MAADLWSGNTEATSVVLVRRSSCMRKGIPLELKAQGESEDQARGLVTSEPLLCHRVGKGPQLSSPDHHALSQTQQLHIQLSSVGTSVCSRGYSWETVARKGGSLANLHGLAAAAWRSRPAPIPDILPHTHHGAPRCPINLGLCGRSWVP